MSELNNEVKEEKPSGKKGWIRGIVAAGIVVAVVILALVLGRDNPKKEIGEALANTFSYDSLLLGALDRWDGKEKEEYSLMLEGSGEGRELSINLNRDDELLQIQGIFQKEGETYAGRLNFTEDKIEAQWDALKNVLFTYRFRESKSGYLLEYLSREDLQILDEALIQFSDLLWGEDRGEIEAKQQKAAGLAQVLLEEFAALEFEKTDKATYKLNGKKVSCKGYTTVLLSENMRATLEKVEEIYAEYGLDYWTFYEGHEYLIDNPFDLLDEALKEFTEMKLTFYLGKGQIVAIILEGETNTGEEKAELLFGECDTDSWSMEIVYEEESLLKLEAGVEETQEQFALELEGVPVGSFIYDDQNSRFDLAVEYYIPLLSVSGEMLLTEEEILIRPEQIESDYLPEDCFFSLSISDHAAFTDLTGVEIDLGNLTGRNMLILYILSKFSSLF